MLVVVVVGKVVSLWIKRRALQYAFREFPGPKPEFLRGNTREVRGRFLTSQHPLLSNGKLLHLDKSTVTFLINSNASVDSQ